MAHGGDDSPPPWASLGRVTPQSSSRPWSHPSATFLPDTPRAGRAEALASALSSPRRGSHRDCCPAVSRSPQDCRPRRLRWDKSRDGTPDPVCRPPRQEHNASRQSTAPVRSEGAGSPPVRGEGVLLAHRQSPARGSKQGTGVGPSRSLLIVRLAPDRSFDHAAACEPRAHRSRPAPGAQRSRVGAARGAR